MASTYSTSLRLELIGTGEQSGTWGVTTNVNLGTLLEQAIGGYQSIAMSDANYTLSTANGAADEARNMSLRFTGTLSASRNVLCPDGIEKLYIVDNSTTGGFSIVFKTVSGTGVTVANGTKAFVYSDGTNVLSVTGSIASQSASSVAITGGSITGITDLAVADGGTGASTAPNARTNLGAAASGANTDITSVYLDNTGLKVKDTNASHGLIIAPGSDLTADRTLTVTTGDSARTLTISGNATVSQDYSTTGNPQFATIELGAASDTTLSRVAAGRVAVEGAELAKQSDVLGQQTIWVPAGAMTPRTTNGAALSSFETATNDVMLRYLAFDPATKEAAQFGIQMPKGWDEGTLIAQFVWTHPATTTNFGVSWELAAVAFANDDAADTAFGTLQEVDDIGGTTYDVYISDETPAITVAGTPGAEEYVMFQVTRDPADAGDTMAVDAWLLGVKIHYTIDSAKDD